VNHAVCSGLHMLSLGTRVVLSGMLTLATLFVLSQNPQIAAPEPQREYRKMHELTATGGVTALAGWLLSYAAQVNSRTCDVVGRCHDLSLWMWFPQVGPWLTLLGPMPQNWVAPVWGLAIMQTMGLAMTIAGQAIRIPVGDAVVEVEPTPVGLSGRF
jgi:hypothetical protein